MLADLDELVLRCRDSRAREVLRESIQSYRSGSNRASIVMCWVAVVFDLISKIRELSLSGDPAAIAETARIEKIIQLGNVTESLRLESDILDIAQKKFELFGPLESIDLNRLREDRHRCAHPSMLSIESRYEPSAEGARLHIRNAVDHLLCHGPTQGKAALDLLFHDVDSPLFPTHVVAARRLLESGPLNRAKEQLIRNFAAATVKCILSVDLDFPQLDRRVAALSATLLMHPAITEKAIRDTFIDRTPKLNSDDMYRLVRLISRIGSITQLLPREAFEKINMYTENVEMIDIATDRLVDILDIPELRLTIVPRLPLLGRAGLTNLAVARPRAELLEPMISYYVKAEEFATANSMSPAIIALIPFMNSTHFEAILLSIDKNHQVAESKGLRPILRALIAKDLVSKDAVMEALEKRFKKSYAERVICD